MSWPSSKLVKYFWLFFYFYVKGVSRVKFLYCIPKWVDPVVDDSPSMFHLLCSNLETQKSSGDPAENVFLYR